MMGLLVGIEIVRPLKKYVIHLTKEDWDDEE